MIPRLVSSSLAVVLLGLPAGCSRPPKPVGTAQGNCRAFLRLADDAGQGKIDSGDEWLKRLNKEVGVFVHGSTLQKSHDRLVRYLTDGQAEQAASETIFLADTCRDILAR